MTKIIYIFKRLKWNIYYPIKEFFLAQDLPEEKRTKSQTYVQKNSK